jgi:hypothetical protein
MKFNLYIPHQMMLDRWGKYAQKEGRSTSQFVRHAVDAYIRRTYLDSVHDEKEPQ